MQLCLVLVCCGLMVGPIWAGTVESVAVAKHNQLRAAEVETNSASNIYALKWNSALAAQAATWTRKCRVEHTPGLDRNIGQNLYSAGYIGSEKPKATKVLKDAIDLWMEEKSLNDGTFACCTRLTMTCCHYTQVVSSRSKEVGCAVEFCPGNQIIVICNYTPMGNFNDQAAYRTGPPCSGCKKKDKCNADKLCVSRKG